MSVEGDRRRAMIALEAIAKRTPAQELELERLRRLERWQRVDERRTGR